MTMIRCALSCGAALIIPVGLMLLGGVITLGISSQGRESGEALPLPPQVGKAYVGEHGSAHLRLQADSADTKTVVLEGQGGAEMARLVSYSNGTLTLEPGQQNPDRFFVRSKPSEPIVMGIRMKHAAHRLEVKARNDGAFEIALKNRSERELKRWLIEADGSVLAKPVPEAVDTATHPHVFKKSIP